MTASVCRPSVRTLLTGLEPLQWELMLESMKREGRLGRERENIRHFATLPRLLAQQGYRTYQAGKLWEADHELAGFEGGTQSNSEPMTKKGLSFKIARQTMEPIFEFVDAEPSQPFLLWFTPQLPHTPHDADARHRERYEGRGLSRRAISYYASVTRFDEAVGHLLDGLDERGLASRTLVVHLSDNGWDQGPHAEGSGLRDGGRGKKTMHELGFRTPITFHWRGHVAPGVVHGDLVSTTDLMPTLLDYAGVDTPPGRVGRSLRPRIEGAATLPARPVIGWMRRSRLRSDPPELSPLEWKPSNPSYFLRTPEWRYIWHQGRDSEELYDLRRNENEAHEVASIHRDVSQRLRGEIIAWRRQLETTLPDR